MPIVEKQPQVTLPPTITPTVAHEKNSPNIGKILRALGGAIDSTGGVNRLNTALISQEQKQIRKSQEKLEKAEQEYQALLRTFKVLESAPEVAQDLTPDGKVKLIEKASVYNLSVPSSLLRGEEEEPEDMGARIISGDSPENERFGLGIPEGEKARVEFTRDPDGTVRGSVLGRFGRSDTNVTTNVKLPPAESKFNETLGKGEADEILKIREAGSQAQLIAPELSQLVELASTTDFKSGSLQPLVTAFQGVAADLGIDMRGALKDAGIADIGDLATKQQADRLFNRIVLDNFEKIKGNLNRQEVQIALSTFGSIGTSEEANIDAIAAAQAASILARETSELTRDATTLQEGRKVLKAKNERGTEKFMQLKEKIKNDIMAKRGNTEAPEGIDPAVWEAMTDEEKALFDGGS